LFCTFDIDLVIWYVFVSIGSDEHRSSQIQQRIHPQQGAVLLGEEEGGNERTQEVAGGLVSALNGVINENDSKKGREVIKKVISYMTLGMDASPVFSEMCRASFTNDEVMKKMIYFYLTTYAEDNPDLAIMAVNTFKKDCKHSSPKIRGLALRSLCSFRSADYLNNALPLIRELLVDYEAYVKKTAIMGLLKVFYV
jgi:AP-4 complex subunit beta-1